ncbi:SGNH/GDSL hydrolase family protein [Anaeromicropila herbilytica]|uniref:Acetylxylan esterase n=1 Tax=Anaeromicropila herbilytica TaxID=2785025 RepID=A0A7R7EHN7_9FIRM|nr:SGNH/GDSL hydrolase family protein [Anaeromicropila herbilytica]BCN28861.1 acetylxylan esterase [Anaeromicropila herbilytica]
MNTYTANESNVKLIGRTYLRDEILWFALSGTGVEFTFQGTKAVITLVGDNVSSVAENKDNYARIAIYVNGERVIDDIIDQEEKTYTVIDSKVEETAVVQIIKLSETAMSTVGVKQIAVEAKDGIHPTKDKEHRIEIIGDSITCGYGMDDPDENHHFSTTTEDVTKAYSYRTIQALNVDYSIFSISGYGIISGYTESGNKIPEQTIPQYYEKLGFSYGDFAGLVKVSSVEWDFTKYQPELIVINLGTNDDSYCQDDITRQEDYKENYIQFIKKVRSYNKDSKILCTLGIMGDRLYPFVEKAVEEYTIQTGDTNIETMRFDVQNPEDGYVADWHPSEITHQKAADKIAKEIKTIMNW